MRPCSTWCAPLDGKQTITVEDLYPIAADIFYDISEMAAAIEDALADAIDPPPTPL